MICATFQDLEDWVNLSSRWIISFRKKPDALTSSTLGVDSRLMTRVRAVCRWLCFFSSSRGSEPGTPPPGPALHNSYNYHSLEGRSE